MILRLWIHHNKMQQLIEEKNALNNKARIVAGILLGVVKRRTQ